MHDEVGFAWGGQWPILAAALAGAALAGAAGCGGGGCPAGAHEASGRCVCDAPYYRDADGDGFGDPATPLDDIACAPTPGFVDNAGDCDDGCADCLPGGTEVCDGRDNDCNGAADDPFECVKGEQTPCMTACGSLGSIPCSASCVLPAASTCVPPPETCDYVDDDCDGVADDGLWALSGPMPVGPAGAEQVRLVATASGFVAVSRTPSGVVGWVLDARGRPTGTEEDLVIASNVWDIDVAADDGQVALMWHDHMASYLKVFDDSLAPVASGVIASEGTPFGVSGVAVALDGDEVLALTQGNAAIVGECCYTLEWRVGTVGDGVVAFDPMRAGSGNGTALAPTALATGDTGAPWWFARGGQVRPIDASAVMGDPALVLAASDGAALVPAGDGLGALANSAGFGRFAATTLGSGETVLDAVGAPVDFAAFGVEPGRASVGLARAGHFVLATIHDDAGDDDVIELRNIATDGVLADDDVRVPQCDAADCTADFTGVTIAGDGPVLIAAARDGEVPLAWLYGCPEP